MMPLSVPAIASLVLLPNWQSFWLPVTKDKDTRV